MKIIDIIIKKMIDVKYEKSRVNNGFLRNSSITGYLNVHPSRLEAFNYWEMKKWG